MENIGESIKQARLAAGLTQEELANKLNTTKSAISRYEQGKREPSLAILARIAIALGTKAEKLISVEAFNYGEEFDKEWERRIKQAGGQPVLLIHNENGKSHVIDLQKERLSEIYDKLDIEDQCQLVKHGELLLNQLKYKDDEPHQD